MHRSRTLGLGVLALGVPFYLLFAIGELWGGDVGGIQHLVPAALCGALLWAGMTRPRAAGRTLLALAIAFGAFAVVLLAGWGVSPVWAVFVVVPAALAGWLLVR